MSIGTINFKELLRGFSKNSPHPSLYKEIQGGWFVGHDMREYRYTIRSSEYVQSHIHYRPSYDRVGKYIDGLWNILQPESHRQAESICHLMSWAGNIDVLCPEGITFGYFKRSGSDFVFVYKSTEHTETRLLYPYQWNLGNEHIWESFLTTMHHAGRIQSEREYGHTVWHRTVQHLIYQAYTHTEFLGTQRLLGETIKHSSFIYDCTKKVAAGITINTAINTTLEEYTTLWNHKSNGYDHIYLITDTGDDTDHGFHSLKHDVIQHFTSLSEVTIYTNETHEAPDSVINQIQHHIHTGNFENVLIVYGLHGEHLGQARYGNTTWQSKHFRRLQEMIGDDDTLTLWGISCRGKCAFPSLSGNTLMSSSYQPSYDTYVSHIVTYMKQGWSLYQAHLLAGMIYRKSVLCQSVHE